MKTAARVGLVCAAFAVVAACHPGPAEVTCVAPVHLTQTSVAGDTITLNTGLRYIEQTTSTGAVLDWCKAIAIQYDAYLLNGTKFDSSHDVGEALIFTPGLGGLIDGLEQGVIGMRVGGKRRLVIPAALGFGPDARRNELGQVVVPGNSTVVYDVELVQVGQ
jgi:peptidylprolyl isomerase